MPSNIVQPIPLHKITPPIAFCIDFIATWITQTGYIWMKFGQLSKEEVSVPQG